MSLSDVVQRTEWLPLLAAVPLVWLALGAVDRLRRRRVERAVGPRARAIAAEASLDRRVLRRALVAGGVMLALVAALGPTWGPDAPGVERRGADVVLCLDVSRSMLARDATPDRLGAAQREIAALAARARGDRLALVAFAGEARLLVPLTEDVRSVATLAELAGPGSVGRGGTDLGAALEAALRALAGRSGGPAAVVLLTDGEDLAGRGREAALRLRERDVVVSCVGLGSPLGSKIAVPAGGEGAGERFLADAAGLDVVSTMDRESLAALAESGGGTFVEAGREPGALVGVYERRIAPLAERALGAERRRLREDRYQAPLLAALLLWTAAWVLPGRRPRVRVPVAAPVVAARGNRRAAAAALLLLLAGCDRTAPGREAYGRGRRADALAAFSRAAYEAGADASPELLYDLALAALAAGEPARAEAAAARAASRGGAAFSARRDFVRGNVLWLRSEVAEAAAAGPEGDPAAVEGALTLTEDALAAWRSAAASREDWPEARRNVERAMLRLERLRRAGARKEGAGREGPPAPPGEGRPDSPALPPPPPPPREPEAGAPPAASGEVGELPAGEVMGVLRTLAEKEREKETSRRASRPAGTSRGERDW